MAQQTFQTRMYEIIGELGNHGFDSALFTDIQDFQKTIALIPTSVKDTGEGVPELFMILMGLAQKYLRGRLLLDEGSSEGTVLEIKEEKGLGKTLGVIIYNGINVIRPFLSTSKKDLLKINKKTFGFFIDDPTNNDDKFLRSRIRKLLINLGKEGLKFNKFYLTLKNLSKSDQVIEFYVDKNILENSKYFEKDKKIILNQSFFNNPEEIILRSIMQVIKRISWKKNYPRGKKVNSLIDSIKFSNKNVKLTLSGCIIEKIQDSVIIYPEKR